MCIPVGTACCILPPFEPDSILWHRVLKVRLAVYAQMVDANFDARRECIYTEAWLQRVRIIPTVA